MIDENRIQAIDIGEHWLIDLFSPLGQCVSLRIDHPQLPPDAKVVSVHHDWSARSFVAIVSHPSFPEVPRGCRTPHFDRGDTFPEMIVKYVDGDRLVDKHPLRTKLESATEIVDLTDDDRLCNERAKAEQFRELAGERPATEWENVVVGAPPNESSRDWFRRVMSQTD